VDELLDGVAELVRRGTVTIRIKIETETKWN
jgi:hypothetical protein